MYLSNDCKEPADLYKIFHLITTRLLTELEILSLVLTKYFHLKWATRKYPLITM